jgi:hypothetical protein
LLLSDVSEPLSYAFSSLSLSQRLPLIARNSEMSASVFETIQRLDKAPAIRYKSPEPTSNGAAVTCEGKLSSHNQLALRGGTFSSRGL